MLPLERRAADALMAAAIDGAPWREALLGVAQACRAQVGSLVVVDKATGRGEGFCEGVEQSWARSFVEREARHVAIGAHFVERGRVFTDRTALPRKMFEASGFYQLWSAPSRQTDYAGVAVVNEPGRFAFVGLSRGPMPGAFSERELEKLQAVAPYIRNAAAVWMKLGARTSVSASLEAAFDAMSDGVLICDGQGRVAYANAAATQILADEDGLSAGPEGLSASGGAGERLKKFIWAAGHGGGGAVSVARPSEQAPYSVHVAPLRSNMRGPSPQGSALVVIVDPASPGVRRMEVLRDLYGLSPAERAVAAAIATGAGVKSAARDLKISPVTVRTHLERIFGKVGVRNQVQLAARIARSLPLKG
jgi:DNA-binding CsgD family transcriptional regulator/PAS domain-containing protein